MNAIESTFLVDQGWPEYPTSNKAADEQAVAVAQRLFDFIKAAEHSLHIAIFDFRLSDALGDMIVQLLKTKAANGVEVCIAYDHTRQAGTTNTDKVVDGADPAPRGTDGYVQSKFAGSFVLLRPVEGSHLMHHKYVVRDGGTKAAAVWTGSANWTDDAWRYQDNNLLTLRSVELAAHYERDFLELWTTGDVKSTGIGDAGSAMIGSVPVDVEFAPGEGSAIDLELAKLVRGARRRIRIASMVISSEAVLHALAAAYQRRIEIDVVIDETQMFGVEENYRRAIQKNPASAAQAKLDLWLSIKPRFVGKRSRPWTPDGLHNFMHDKLVVVDDVVATGSFNISQNATHNAENVVFIEDASLADRYAEYIGELSRRYRR